MIYALLWMVLLVTIYIGTYLMNKHTPVPDGCDDMIECEGCLNVACSHYKAKEE